MTLPSERLASLDLALPAVARPVGAYAPAVVVGDACRTSGQLPLVDGALVATGVVGTGIGHVSPEMAAECARVAALNALAALADAADGLDRVTRVVRVVGYVASDASFTGQATVLNAASDLMIAVFGEDGRHVRSAVGVATLPLGAPVEIEVEALLGPRQD